MYSVLYTYLFQLCDSLVLPLLHDELPSLSGEGTPLLVTMATIRLKVATNLQCQIIELMYRGHIHVHMLSLSLSLTLTLPLTYTHKPHRSFS